MTDVRERIAAAKARDEAKAEAEPPDEDEQAEAEETEAPPPAEAEPPAPEPPVGAMTAETAAELEKATTAYYKRINKAFAGASPPECRTCNGLGFDLTFGAGEPSYAAHEQFRACAECRGLGQVLTGSKALGQETRECPGCTGRGYLERLSPPGPNGEQEAAYGTPSWMGTAGPPSMPPAPYVPAAEPQAWMGGAGPPGP